MVRIVRVTGKSNSVMTAARILRRELRRDVLRPLLFLSSGGSALGILDVMSPLKKGAPCAIGVLDERVTNRPSARNSRALSNTAFVKGSCTQGARFIHCVQRIGDTPQKVARRYESSICGWLEANKGCRVIVTMGIGTDGHTAGIFPAPDPRAFRKRYDSAGKLFIGHRNGAEPFRDRVTASIPFLKRNVDFGLVFACSSEKRQAVGRVRARRGSLARTPARIVREIRKAVLLYSL